MPNLYFIYDAVGSENYDLFVRELSPRMAERRWRQFFVIGADDPVCPVVRLVPEVDGPLGAISWQDVARV